MPAACCFDPLQAGHHKKGSVIELRLREHLIHETEREAPYGDEHLMEDLSDARDDRAILNEIKKRCGPTLATLGFRYQTTDGNEVRYVCAKTNYIVRITFENTAASGLRYLTKLHSLQEPSGPYSQADTLPDCVADIVRQRKTMRPQNIGTQ